MWTCRDNNLVNSISNEFQNIKSCISDSDKQVSRTSRAKQISRITDDSSNSRESSCIEDFSDDESTNHEISVNEIKQRPKYDCDELRREIMKSFLSQSIRRSTGRARSNHTDSRAVLTMKRGTTRKISLEEMKEIAKQRKEAAALQESEDVQVLREKEINGEKTQNNNTTNGMKNTQKRRIRQRVASDLSGML